MWPGLRCSHPLPSNEGSARPGKGGCHYPPCAFFHAGHRQCRSPDQPAEVLAAAVAHIRQQAEYTYALTVLVHFAPLSTVMGLSWWEDHASCRRPSSLASAQVLLTPAASPQSPELPGHTDPLTADVARR